ncbi:pentapeptide repeat-containing protein [Arhodomonas sp. SL1]|uniref:pentapeptide repeat-containing protein n=1 Tax=Arhodomonas sp. SL1 TaxID=3425691 RepID=UPI003F880C57
MSNGGSLWQRTVQRIRETLKGLWFRLPAQLRHKFEGDPSVFQRFLWRYRAGLWFAVSILAVVFVAWLFGVWSAIGALRDQAVRVFAVIEQTPLPERPPPDPSQAFRNLLWGISALGGALVAVAGLLLAGWRSYTQARAAQIENRRVETETFARAIEHLGNDDFAIRLGAILSLESLARESPRLHQPIMEAFCAYIREKRPWPPLTVTSEQENATEHQDGDDETPAARGEGPESSSVGVGDTGTTRFPADLQAILTAIGRRERRHESSRAWLLLRNTDLRRADLSYAHFEDIDLGGAQLEVATLSYTHLDNGCLEGSHLECAGLIRTRLQFANLQGAHLEGAGLLSAELEGADLSGVHLENAMIAATNLKGADLTGAHLTNAQFQDVNIRGTRVNMSDICQNQIDNANGDSSTVIPAGLVRPTHWEISP